MTNEQISDRKSKERIEKEHFINTLREVLVDIHRNSESSLEIATRIFHSLNKDLYTLELGDITLEIVKINLYCLAQQIRDVQLSDPDLYSVLVPQLVGHNTHWTLDPCYRLKNGGFVIPTDFKPMFDKMTGYLITRMLRNKEFESASYLYDQVKMHDEAERLRRLETQYKNVEKKERPEIPPVDSMNVSPMQFIDYILEVTKNQNGKQILRVLESMIESKIKELQ